MANPFRSIDLRWVLTVLVTIVAATAIGVAIGLWLGS
jgi:hypothetical protein